MQSISEFLESHGYVAKDGVYVRDTQIIDPQEWLGLSLESFSRKAIGKGWTRPLPISMQMPSSYNLIPDTTLNESSSPSVITETFSLIPASELTKTRKNQTFEKLHAISRIDFSRRNFKHPGDFIQSHKMTAQERIRFDQDNSSVMPSFPKLLLMIYHLQKAATIKPVVHLKAVHAKEKQKRRIEMTDDEKVGYVSKYEAEAYFDLLT